MLILFGEIVKNQFARSIKATETFLYSSRLLESLHAVLIDSVSILVRDINTLLSKFKDILIEAH